MRIHREEAKYFSIIIHTHIKMIKYCIVSIKFTHEQIDEIYVS